MCKQSPLLLQGTSKIEKNCTATIKTETVDDGSITAYVCHSHYGHKTDLQHLSLTERQKKSIASKMKMKIPGDVIIDEIRQSVATTYQRIHLVEPKDLHNIARDFRLDNTKLHENDQDSVAAWIKDFQSKENNPVLFSKLQGDRANGLKKEDFIIILQTPYQKQMYLTFAVNGVLVDSTHGTNMYDFLLTTIMVVDEFGEGEPAGWCIANHEDYSFMVVFFECIRKNCGEVTPRWFMSDLAPQFYDAFSAVNKCQPPQFFCTFHVDRAWKEEIPKKVSDPKTADDIYKMLRTILELLDVNSFQDYLSDLNRRLMTSNQTIAFSNYFQRHWVSKKEKWAYCYRVGQGINTNMYLEAYHRVLKHKYLGGKYNRRVDKCLMALLKYDSNRVHQRLIKLFKGGKGNKLTELHQRHKSSLQMSTSNVKKIDDTNWEVLSAQQDSEDTIYNVTLVAPECVIDHCQLKCTECKVCTHIFCCTCPDYKLKLICCKHIHLVQRTRNQTIETGESEYKEKEIECAIAQVKGPEKESLQKIKDNIKDMLNTMMADVDESNEQDIDDLKELQKRLHTDRRCFMMAKESNKKEQIRVTEVMHPKKNLKRQRDHFFSTKRKRKTIKKNRLLKPNKEERKSFKDPKSWEVSTSKQKNEVDQSKKALVISEG